MSTFTASPNAKIRVIKASKDSSAPIDPNDPNVTASKKKRVCAYARVSTEQDEQQNSYETQVNYYMKYINDHPDWEFVDIYSDEGITGTNIKKREGFKRMIADAKAGKIDLILTKSISRFARNTVDSLTTIRELKEIGVEIWFEKENIRTLDPQGEILLTIMSSLAQEESRSISANVTWGVRKRMEEGQVRFAFGRFLGYRKGPDGRPGIVEEEAKIIRDIYQWFLDGLRTPEIRDRLEAKGILTPTGKTHWTTGTILSILSNEKYKGDALLQKTVTVDFLSKKVKKNDGDKTQFYIENSHPAIIDPDIFDLVQYELQRRRDKKVGLRSNNTLSGAIRCGHCGDYYGHKVYHYRNGFRYDAWACNNKCADRKNCDSPNVKQTEIEATFAVALKIAIDDKEHNIIDEEAERKIREQLEQVKQEAELKRDEAEEALDDYRTNNTKRSLSNETAYKKQCQILKEKLEQCETKLNEAKEAIVLESAKKMKKRIFIKATLELDPDNITFNSVLFSHTVEEVVVKRISNDRHIVYSFTNGYEIDINLDREETADNSIPEPEDEIMNNEREAIC